MNICQCDTKDSRDKDSIRIRIRKKEKIHSKKGSSCSPLVKKQYSIASHFEQLLSSPASHRISLSNTLLVPQYYQREHNTVYRVEQNRERPINDKTGNFKTVVRSLSKARVAVCVCACVPAVPLSGSQATVAGFEDQVGVHP